MANYQKHKNNHKGFIADGTARITESSSSMVTDGMEDQSDEDSGKFMFKF